MRIDENVLCRILYMKLSKGSTYATYSSYNCSGTPFEHEAQDATKQGSNGKLVIV